ncbi:MAG: DUF4097 family beta strand repeat-containing protein [Oscillospiraceae bacterium]
MSKKIIISLVTAFALIIAGGAICFFCLMKSDWRIGGEELFLQEKRFSADINALEVQMDTSDLIISPYDGDEIVITYYDSEKNKYFFEESADKLTISQSNTTKWYENLSVNFRPNEYKTKILVPKTYEGAFNLSNKVGEVELYGFTVKSDFSLNTTVGKIKITDSSFEKSASISATTGDIDILSCTFAENCSVSCTTGEIDIKSSSAKYYNISATTGEIDCDNIFIGSSLVTETTLGDISCSISDSYLNYRISGSSKIGDCKMPLGNPSGEKSVTAKASTGDIEISFNDYDAD